MDIRELLLHMRAESSNRRIERDTGVDRRTVKEYREWAKAQGLLAGPLPPVEDLQVLLEQTMPRQLPPQNVSAAEEYREVIEQLLDQNVEIAAIHCRLKSGATQVPTGPCTAWLRRSSRRRRRPLSVSKPVQEKKHKWISALQVC